VSRLVVERLSARHGLLQAVRDVSFELDRGEIVALVGANGAGKTTLLRALAGAHPVFAGRVRLDGIDVTDLPAEQRVRLGIALVPEGRRLFAPLTVMENLLLARSAGRSGPWTIDTVMADFPQLQPLRKARAGTLSGGEQQAVAIARALLTNPEILLLDEVSLGLSPLAVDRVYKSLNALIAAATTIILVEQDLRRALSVAHRVICLREGSVVLTGRAADTPRDRIMAAYFGTDAADAVA
jgi:branched-chain amino acid transport system ATP-binding protein